MGAKKKKIVHEQTFHLSQHRNFKTVFRFEVFSRAIGNMVQNTKSKAFGDMFGLKTLLYHLLGSWKMLSFLSYKMRVTPPQRVLRIRHDVCNTRHIVGRQLFFPLASNLLNNLPNTLQNSQYCTRKLVFWILCFQVTQCLNSIKVQCSSDLENFLFPNVVTWGILNLLFYSVLNSSLNYYSLFFIAKKTGAKRR